MLVLISEVEGKGVDKDVVVVAGKSAVECVTEKGAKDAAPDCGSHTPYGWAKVSVDVVCEVGSNPQGNENGLRRIIVWRGWLMLRLL